MNKIKIILFGISLIWFGCYYDSQETLYGTSAQSANCDTTNTTYSKTIEPIIAANCYTCHSSTQGQFNGNIILDNPESLQQQAANGKLIGDINQSPGFHAMPNNGTKLSQCDIAKIQHWVDMGTPNN